MARPTRKQTILKKKNEMKSIFKNVLLIADHHFKNENEFPDLCDEILRDILIFKEACSNSLKAKVDTKQQKQPEGTIKRRRKRRVGRPPAAEKSTSKGLGTVAAMRGDQLNWNGILDQAAL